LLVVEYDLEAPDLYARIVKASNYLWYCLLDLISGLRGRSVLTLIEIAYQAADVTNPSNLARILDIPLSSISDEIKKLIQLGYLEYHLSPKMLQDGRYRNYVITGKGVSFLRILKGALELTINRLKEKKHDFLV